jgi:hypothetical protein
MTESQRTSRFPARLRNLGPRERAIAIILGIIVLLAVVFLLLSGGGEEEIPGAGSNPVVRGTPSPTAVATPPPETGQAFEGKDPFQPIVVAEPTPTGTESPTPTPTGSQTGVNGGGTTNPAMTVTLLDIRKQDGELVATVEVEDKQYNVSEGDTFAGNFRVISLSSSCGTFVFGDERFSLCIGQEVHK